MKVQIACLLATLFCSVCVSRAEPPAVIVSSGEVFNYPNADPYDRNNDYGFNHAPSVTRLSDGRLLAAWFSGPFEASVHQVIDHQA